MAKNKTRKLVGMVCSVCGAFNKVTQRNTINTPEPLKLSMYCKSKTCQKHTIHTEKKKLG